MNNDTNNTNNTNDTNDTALTIALLKDGLLRRLGDEVDLIFRYGSSIKGTMHAYSDLDISYVPVHEATWDNITITLDNTLIDLYPIHWSKLERMADFEDISSSILFDGQIIYQRSEAEAERFRALGQRLRGLLEPAASHDMLGKAQTIFEQAAYPYFLLRQEAERGHRLACMQQARRILTRILHALAVANQRVIDTRKRNQVMGLEKLPADFASTVDTITLSTEPAELLNGCERLMQNTRALLLAEQARLKTAETSFREVFGAGYPELKNDLQHVMLACERRDMFNSTLVSLYHELMIHMAQALTGISYSDFNSISEYEQNLTALGFPDLLAYVTAGDFEGLHEQCNPFDKRLQQFLTEHEVPLYSFATLEELKAHLA